MQGDAGKFRHGPICQAARQAAREPSVFPFIAPSTNNVKALFQLFDESGNLFRIVLQISIHGDNDLAVSSVETGFQRGGLAEVPPQRDDAHTRIRSLNVRKDRHAAVCAPVVNEDDLIGLTKSLHYIRQQHVERQRAAFFVKNRYYDRIFYSALLFHRSYSDLVVYASVPSVISACLDFMQLRKFAESMRQNR